MTYADLRPTLLALLSNAAGALEATRRGESPDEPCSRIVDVIEEMSTKAQFDILVLFSAWVVTYLAAINGLDEIHGTIADLVDTLVETGERFGR